jgi:hypothetical protein
LPHQLRTSTIPEKNRFYSDLVEKCVAAIVDAAGAESIRAILMIGAPARSEVTVVEIGGRLFSLSDIDLVCACARDVDTESLKRRLAGPMEALNGQLSDSCAGVDVAVKTEMQLAEPAPLIANYEMIRSPVVVWGDERFVASLGDVDIADIPNTESLKLVHNRMTEELLLRPVENRDAGRCPSSLTSLYGTAKLVLDLISAHLFIRNNVPTGYEDRVALFVSDVLPRRESARVRTRLEEFTSELPAWAVFKTTGDLTALSDALGGSSGTGDLDRIARDAWNRYIGYAEALWRDVLGHVTRTDTAGMDIDRMGRVYQKLEGFPRSFVRAHKMLRPGRAPSGLFPTVGTYWRARLGSPGTLAYLTAALTYLSFSEAVDWMNVAGTVLRYCPFELPSGFASMGTDEQRSILIERLAVYHKSVLLGRKEG